MLRKLRITFSAVCGIVCLLLVVLWVRSYSTLDSVGARPGLYVASHRGNIYWRPKYYITFIPGAIPPTGPLRHSQWFKLDSVKGVTPGTSPLLPIWFPVIVTAGLVIAPWLKWQFSLRTLLIATTLVAVVLGIIVFVAKK